MLNPPIAPIPGNGSDFRVGDVLTRSFKIFRRHFLAFTVLALVPNIPAYLYGLVQGSRVGNQQIIFDVSDLLLLLGGLVADGAIIHSVVQKLRGRNFSVGPSLAISLDRIIPVAAVSIVVFILVGLGSILLVVPGIMIFCACYVAVPACLVERTEVLASISLSTFLTRGYRWQIFAISVISAIAVVIATAIAEYGVALAIMGIIMLLGAQGLSLIIMISYIQSFGVLVLFSASLAFCAVVSGVSYLQLLVVKNDGAV